MLPLWFHDFFNVKKHRNFVPEMSKETFKISVKAEGNNAVIRISGRIADWNNSASDFKYQLDALIKQGIVDADIYINTLGGDCFQAAEIVNEILRFTGTTHARLGAVCASAGTYIASKCTKVTAAANTNYMFHKPMMGTEGNVDQIKAELKLLENLQSDYAKAYSKKTGLTIQKIESMWIQDYWMNAQEAKTLGFVDAVEGEADITEQDVLAFKALKGAPSITATAVQSTDTHNLDKQMKNLITTAMGLAENSTEAQAIAHYETIKAKAAKADELQIKLDALQKDTKEKAVEAELKLHTDAKRITAAQHSFWKKQLLADFTEAKTALDSMPAMVKLSAEITGGANDHVDRSTWTYADYQEKDPKALEVLATNDEPKFMALYNAHYNQSK